ncbi:ATP-binding protein [Candidatus Woesearchaeota archaeon]|nr:ATP-binding protein [Candidatus Woesearchaeota archaeon]
MSRTDTPNLTELLGFRESERVYETSIQSHDTKAYSDALYALMDDASARLAMRLGKDHRAGRLSDGLKMDIGTVVLELGMNAAKDGNRYQAGTKVQFGFYLWHGKLSIAVMDEGLGFDPQTTIEKIYEEDEPEESVSEILKRIDTSQFELPADDPAIHNGCGLGLKRVIRGLRTFHGLHAQKYEDGLCVRVDLDLRKSYNP